MKRSSLSHDEQLMRMARAVAKLEGRARALRLQLRKVSAELRAERKTFKAYAQNVADSNWANQAPPLRTFGEK